MGEEVGEKEGGEIRDIDKLKHFPITSSFQASILNIIILKFYTPVLLNLLGNIFPYCPAVEAIRRINSSSIDFPGRSILDL